MDLRVLYNRMGEANSADIFNFFSNLILSHKRYFNEIIFMKISKLSGEALDIELLFGVSSRSKDLPPPNAVEIQDVLESLLLLDFTGQGFMFLSHKEATEFDAAVLVKENDSDYYVAFFNETVVSYDEIGASEEELNKVFSSLTKIVREKLHQYI